MREAKPRDLRGPISPTAWRDETGGWRTKLRGRHVLSDPRINKGTAFSDEERESLGILGLLPPAHLTLEQQAKRVYGQYLDLPSNLAKNLMLGEVRDRNEVLFYRVLADHLTEMLPIVYTPTVGEAIERYSQEYRRPRGVYLSVDRPDRIEESLRDTCLGPGDVDLVVATDSQAILGIGDWGVGGIDIAVGKLAVYTAAGGIRPDRAIPVMLDVGTDRPSLLEDPLYIGNRHPRVDTATYDDFVDRFVQAVTKLFPDAMLHWEDIGVTNARRLLEKYRQRILTFNDDVQGTGVVNLAAVLSAVRAAGRPLAEHRVVVFGAGTAGMGIVDQLRAAMVSGGMSNADAAGHFWAVDRFGLITDSTPEIRPPQRPYARSDAEVEGWRRGDTVEGIDLAEVVRRVHPTVLIGTSARTGAFSEAIVCDMAAHVERPVILPISNPTALAEAVPADLVKWTRGRALVATGSPFDPVTHDRVTYEIGQANNALVFPGLGLGVIASRATRVTDHMLAAAAGAVADLVDTTTVGASLLPHVDDLRATSLAVAVAVAEAARLDGVARTPASEHTADAVAAQMWDPSYRPVRPA
jgi:malate dehydrogenase (oxaloacetate-decarboxylating)